MPDDISQAVPTEEIAPEAEVQETTAPDASTQTEPQTEKPLTAEDYRQIAREEAMRVAQSQVAKSENRIDRRIQERFDALEANKGVLKLTDEQVVLAKREIINEEQMNAYAKPQVPQASGTEGQANSPDEVLRQQVDFVYGQINAVFDEVGAEVTQNDPEFKVIQDALNNPKGSLAGTLRAASKAAETKAERLKAHKENANARVTGGGGSTNATTKTMTAEEKISAGLKNSTWPSQEPTPQK